MKTIISLLAGGLFSLLLFSCSSGYEPIVTSSTIQEIIGIKAEMPEFTSSFDIKMNDFAQAVGDAMRNNSGFRKLIHQEALVQFDGDYDVLLKRVAKRTIEASDYSFATRSAGEVSVGELLESYFPENAKTRTGGASIIEELQALFPHLQISVPVHAEEWNPEEYTPTVAFLPEDYNDETIEAIPGYDSNGDFVWVDAINIPDMPVIVVGLSERNNNAEGINPWQPLDPLDPGIPLDPPVKPVDLEPEDPPTPEAPTELTGVQTEEGILLSWQQNGEEPDMYYIYKKGPGQYKYNIIAIEGYQNPFEVTTTTANQYYSFYIKAVNINSYKIAESPASNTISIKAPPAPKPMSNFEAVLSGQNVELRWNNDGDLNSEVKIEYMVPEIQASYRELIKKSGTDDSYYIYSSPYRGTKVAYRATRVNKVGKSDAKTDYIYPPYRNADAASPVYIKQITFTDKRLERWPAGKPEFYLKVLGTNDSGGTVELQRQMEFIYDDYAMALIMINDRPPYESQIFTNRKAVDWRYFTDRSWYSALTFQLEEFDRPNAQAKFNISASFNVKGPNDLQTGAAASIEVTFDNKGEDCGSAVLNYFDNPEMWLSFPNYGARVLISEKP